MRWLALAALCAGCKGKQPPPPKHEDARPAPADAAIDAPVDAPPDAPAMSTAITSDGVGPITAKHIDVEDYKQLLAGMTVTADHKEGEDFMYDEYIAKKGKTQILRAVITDRSLFKIEVDDPMFATAAGVAVGMTVGEAAERMKDLKCVYETYDPQADAERVDRSLRCEGASLPQVMFEIDLAGFKGPEGNVGTKAIAKRKIAQIVWLAAKG